MLRPSGKSMKPALQSWQSRKLRQAPRVGGLQSHLEKGRFTDEIASDYGSLRSPAGYSVFGAGFGCAVRRLRQERHDLRPDEDPDLYERRAIPGLRQVRHDLRQVRDDRERGAGGDEHAADTWAFRGDSRQHAG